MQDLAGLLAKLFIARKDVKAVQSASGDYMPVQHCETCGRGYCSHDTPKIREGWKRADIMAHLDGQKTYGHYVLDTSDQCKFFAFDIDLEPQGIYPFPYEVTENLTEEELHKEHRDFFPREAWLDRAHPARGWMKFQLHFVAHTLAEKIHRELEIPVAVTYTGAKGLHVYGLTGLMSAKDVREGAQIVIDSLADTSLGALNPTRGTNFFKFDNQDPVTGQPNVQIEVFPKQDSLDGKDLGNLVRLPLGRNMKNPKDPTFFVDMTSSLSEIKPLDPIFALTDGARQPWRRQGE